MGFHSNEKIDKRNTHILGVYLEIATKKKDYKLNS